MFRELETEIRAQPQPGRGPRPRPSARHMMLIGILPTIDEAHLTAERVQREPALPAPQRADLRRPRRGPRDRRSAAPSGCRPSPTRSPPRRPARASSSTSRSSPRRSRRTGTRPRRSPACRWPWRANSPVLLRQGALARDAHRALRAGHRHAPRGAQGPGRAPAGLVRRALDHLDLRPVRGERALLPGAAARCARTRTRSRRSSAATCPGSPSCACTTARSTAGTARSTTWSAGARTCGWRTGCCPAGPTVVDILANAAFYYGLRALARPRTSGRSGRRCRSRPPRRTCTPAPATGSTRACTGPGVGEVPVAELVLRRLLPLAHEGLERAGVDAADREPAARDHRAALRRACTNGAVLAGRGLPPPLRRARARPRRRAARAHRALSRADALERARAHLARALTLSDRSARVYGCNG